LNAKAQSGAWKVKGKTCTAKSALLLLVVLTAVALALRLVTLSRASLWLDEAAEARFAALPLSDCWSADRNVPPLNRVMLHFWTRAFGDSEFSLRFPAMILGTLCVPAIYLLAAQTFGRRVGLLAAFLTAVSPPAIEFSQEARQYSLLVLVTILATYFFLRSVDKPRAVSFGLYAAFTAIGMYTHYLFALVILAHLAWYAVSGRRSRAGGVGVVLACTLAAVLYLSWLPQLVDAAGKQERDWVAYPLFQVYHTFHHFGPGMSAYDVRWLGSEHRFAGEAFADLDLVRTYFREPAAGSMPVRVIWTLTFYLLSEAVLVFGFVIPLLVGLFLAARAGHMSAYFTIAFALPVIVLAALFWWVPVLYPRYMKFLFPCYVILISLFLCGADFRILRRAAVGCITALILLSLCTYYFSPTYGKEDFRSAGAYLNEKADADDIIVCCPGYVDAAVTYYYHGSARVIRCDSGVEADVLARSLAEQTAGTGSNSRIWVVIRGNEPKTGILKLDKVFRRHFGDGEHAHFETGWGVHVYMYAGVKQH